MNYADLLKYIDNPINCFYCNNILKFGRCYNHKALVCFYRQDSIAFYYTKFNSIKNMHYTYNIGLKFTNFNRSQLFEANSNKFLKTFNPALLLTPEEFISKLNLFINFS